MCRYILLLVVLLGFASAYSQDLDLIVAKNGDSIACVIDSISSKYVYCRVKFNGKWMETFMDTAKIYDIKHDCIDKKTTQFKPGTTFIVTSVPMSDTDFIKPGPALFVELLGKGYYSLNADFGLIYNGRVSAGITSIDYNRNSLSDRIIQRYLSINARHYLLAGNRASKLELGAGISFPVLKIGPENANPVVYNDEPKPYVWHGVVGYRWQKKIISSFVQDSHLFFNLPKSTGLFSDSVSVIVGNKAFNIEALFKVCGEFL